MSTPTCKLCYFILYIQYIIFGRLHSALIQRFTMSGILRSIEENDLHGKARDAMRANKPEELRMLLSTNKAKKLIRKTGGNVLSYCLTDAIGHRHFECIQELLKAGANPCVVGECNPVMRTIMYGGNLKVLKLLLEYGAHPNSDSGPGTHVPLYFLANFADPGCFRMLLLYGADPDYNCSHRYFLNSTPDPTSVLGMCLTNDYEVLFVKLLIQFGANMYLPDIQKILMQADNDAARLLNKEKVNPRSLMSQCRIAIRRLLNQVKKLSLIDQLAIPNKLVRYLQYHDELDNPEKFPRHYREYSKYHMCV
ncbi:ankyrin repeat and SOCS box protein 12-like isoform X3 [Rhinoderma darwinii]|uniref:ankyrin repeat and SOCS box protein 12-like isoform X3 n=1 Tax=Rhinoderma darwinii TaxID=43563 RepID=UPI003F660CE9